jgi:hypothetical protein
MKDKSVILKQILIDEDNCSNKTIYTLPIDIENSALAAEVKPLLFAIEGFPSIQPYCDVGARVLMRIADLLMGVSVMEFFDL